MSRSLKSEEALEKIRDYALMVVKKFARPKHWEDRWYAVARMAEDGLSADSAKETTSQDHGGTAPSKEKKPL